MLLRETIHELQGKGFQNIEERWPGMVGENQGKSVRVAEKNKRGLQEKCELVLGQGSLAYHGPVCSMKTRQATETTSAQNFFFF
jgi:hypothetical protein